MPENFTEETMKSAFLRQKGRPSLQRQRDRRYTSWDEYSFSIALRLI
jgi:hypothetical protein